MTISLKYNVSIFVLMYRCYSEDDNVEHICLPCVHTFCRKTKTALMEFENQYIIGLSKLVGLEIDLDMSYVPYHSLNNLYVL